jgi:hypothetical protein
MRGDVSDNIKSAYPRVPEAKLREAYADRGGAKWNNLINATWGKLGETNSVRDVYEMNLKLIDLSAQPEPIVTAMDAKIDEMISKPISQMVELNFERFCSEYGVSALFDAKADLVPLLSSPYRLE